MNSAMKRGNDEVARMRKLCDNTIQVATLFYMDESNRRRQLIMVGISKVLSLAHGTQNKEQRSADGSLKWLLKQVAGECIKPLNGVVKAL